MKTSLHNTEETVIEGIEALKRAIRENEAMVEEMRSVMSRLDDRIRLHHRGVVSGQAASERLHSDHTLAA